MIETKKCYIKNLRKTMIKDYENKIGDLDKRIDVFGKVIRENIQNMIGLMCLKRDLTYTNTKEILEYHLKDMVEKYGDDWYKDDGDG